MAQFLPLFSILHLGMIFLVILVILFAQALGKQAEKHCRLEQFSRHLGFLMLGIWLFYVLYNFSPSRFSWEESLPLEVCDMLALASVFVLLTKARIFRSILYFSAILLTSQALLTPAGIQDPATLRFWLYWAFHAGILVISVFDFYLRSYRPQFRDLVQAWIVNFLYLALVLTFDILWGWNYGFVGNTTPEAPTLLDFFGPWPERLFFMLFALCLAQGAIMYLPVKIFSRRDGKNSWK